MERKWKMKNWQREQMARKWMDKGGEEDREFVGRSALREICKEWEERTEELETGDRERGRDKSGEREEKTKKQLQ